MPRDTRLFEPLKMTAGFALMMLLYFLPYLLLYAGVDYFVVTNYKELILHEIYAWLVPGVLYVYVVKVEKQTFLPLGEREYGAKWYFLNLLKLFFMCYGISVLVYVVVKLTEAPTQSPVMENMTALFKNHRWMVMMVSLRAGVTEEIIFRGYVFVRLEKYFSRPWIPILVSALLFSLLHAAYGTLSQVLFPFLFGLLFAWHYYKYRNIKLLIILHFLWDLLSINLALR